LDQAVITALAGFGMPAMGFLFLWLFMRHYFKQVEKNNNVETTLGELMRKISALRESQLVSVKTYEHLDDEITKQTELLKAISKGILELVKKIHFGNIAVQKGYMTEEQVRDVFRSESED